MDFSLERCKRHLRKWQQDFLIPQASLGDDFLSWREKIMRIILGTGLSLGFFVLIPSVAMTFRSGFWWLGLFDLVIYAAMIVLMFAVKIQYRIRAGLIVATCFATGVWIICNVGFLSGGSIWLFLFAVYAGILLGVRAAVVSVLVNALTLMILGFWTHSGLIGSGQPYFPDPQRAIVAGVNYIFINALVAISISVVMWGLQRTIKNEQAARAELKDEVEIRNQAEQFLKESEQKYRVLAENITDVIWMMDMQMRFTYVSPVVQKLLGWTPKEIEQLTLNQILTPQAYETAMQVWSERLSGVTMQRDAELSATLNLDHQHRDGSIIATEVKVVLLKGEYGNAPVGILGVTRDITERIRQEREKEALYKKLAGMRKMEALGLLAGGVAHDLNNVLSGIVSYPDLLLMDLPQDSPMRESLETIRRSGRKAAEIVQDLLALTRRGVQSMVVLDPNQVIREYLASPEFKLLARHSAGVKVETDLARDLLPVRGSTVHLKKALMNLVHNAAEAQPGGGAIRIRTRNHFLETSVSAGEQKLSGDCVVLEVSDRGEGIRQEDLSRIFEPFYTRKHMGRSGTGLGLAVVWGTVQDHHGHIDVKSRPGHGTTFTLYLPATREPLQTGDTALSSVTRLGRGQTIVVVDDMDDQLDLAVMILRRLNYRPVAFSSGESAVAFLQDHEADLVLLDMIMDPGMDGLDTYRQIIKTKPAIKALIASGYSETDRVREAVRLGVGGYIKKPYMLEEISRALKAELD